MKKLAFVLSGGGAKGGYEIGFLKAINELGMVYAEPNQVILYDGGTDDYVRQNGSIPSDYSSVKDKLLGKDGE